MSHSPAVLEISSSALKHNFHYFKSKIKQSTKILAVIKADGYGCSSTFIGKILEQEHVDYLAVAYVQEGIALRKANIKCPILVLFPQMDNLDEIINYDLEPNLYSLISLKLFCAVVNKSKQSNYPIHLKLNTGMNRQGYTKSEITALKKILSQEKNIQVKSICTHFTSSSKEADNDFSHNQIKQYLEMYKSICSVLDDTPLKHVSNTSGIINFPEYQFDMVRLGIGLYGFGNDPNITKDLQLVPRLKTNIFQKQYLEKGESIGYNRTFNTEKKSTIAVIPLGYSDGLNRALSNKGHVFIHGKKAPIVGSVCMDITMVDVTNITCNIGDEVVIFEHQKDVLDMAEMLNTISYEIITTISPRIERVLL